MRYTRTYLARLGDHSPRRIGRHGRKVVNDAGIVQGMICRFPEVIADGCFVAVRLISSSTLSKTAEEESAVFAAQMACITY